MMNERNVITERDTVFGTIAIIALAVCSLLAGFLPHNAVLALAVAAISFLLVWKDELHLVFPFIIFYNDWYGMVFGMSVQRLFSLLLIFLFFVRRSRSRSVALKYLAPLAVYFLYCLFVMSRYDTQSAIFSFVDVLCCVILVSVFLLKDPFNLKRFFTAYAVAALCALVTGVMHKNLMIYGILSRFLATFEDPNYIGFFYTVAIFAMVSLELFKPWIRAVLTVVFYVAVFASASLSAVIVNVVLWLIYITLTQRMRPSTLILCLGGLALCLGLYSYGIAHPEDNIIGQISGRIHETLTDLKSGDLSGASTKRTEFAAEHLAYFMNLPFLQKLFGGTAVNTSVIDPVFEAAAHNEYVDMLLNVGVVGTVVLLWFFLKSLRSYFVSLIRTKNEHCLCLVMLKCIWLLYGLTLTVFMDDRFMLLFFL